MIELSGFFSAHLNLRPLCELFFETAEKVNVFLALYLNMYYLYAGEFYLLIINVLCSDLCVNTRIRVFVCEFF
jgi:hypothetical protein